MSEKKTGPAEKLENQGFSPDYEEFLAKYNSKRRNRKDDARIIAANQQKNDIKQTPQIKSSNEPRPSGLNAHKRLTVASEGRSQNQNACPSSKNSSEEEPDKKTASTTAKKTNSLNLHRESSNESRIERKENRGLKTRAERDTFAESSTKKSKRKKEKKKKSLVGMPFRIWVGSVKVCLISFALIILATLLFFISPRLNGIVLFANFEGDSFISYTVACYNKDVKNIKIPKKHFGFPVTKIDIEAFDNCANLTSVTIPDSITSIGNGAFMGCKNLSSINIPDSVISIGEDAFKGCSKLLQKENGVSYVDKWVVDWYEPMETVVLRENTVGISDAAFCDSYGSLFEFGAGFTSITIPDSVTSIGNAAFYDCENLSSIIIPDNVTYIGDEAFYGCNSLEKVTIGNGVTKIGDSTFYQCNSLEKVNIPDSVISIGEDAFKGCSKLLQKENGVSYVDKWVVDWYEPMETVILRENTVGISDTAFSSSNNLTCVIIGNNVTNIGKNAFYECNNLTNVTIPDSVTSIGNDAFRGCDHLISITIGKNVTSIGEDAFYECYKLIEVINHSSLDIEAGSIGDGYVACYAKEVHTGESKIVNIGDYLFYVGDDDNYLFEYIGENKELTLPESYNGENYEIYDYAFQNRDEIVRVTIPNSVTKIGYKAFYSCSKLRSVNIPESVTRIDNQAFEYCNKLLEVINNSSFNIKTGSKRYGYVACYAKEVHTGESKIVNIDNCLFYSYDNVNYLLEYVGEDTKLVLPENYNGEGYEICTGAFSRCSSLTSITIPDSVTSIGEYAFAGCSSLTSITIGSGVTSIGNSAFYNCFRLTIYCEAESKPDGWDSDWNYSNCPVVWNAK